MVKKIVFTDLDGTILDAETYDYATSLPVIRLLKKHKIPIILCSSKTRLEMQTIRRNLKIHDPFIIENGSAIVLPEKYFAIKIKAKKISEDYMILEFGAKIKKFKPELKKILASLSVRYSLFTEMSAQEISQDSGLSIKQARLAKNREYTETIKLEESRKNQQEICRALFSVGLECTFGGRYLTVGRGGSKGIAVRALKKLYQRNLGNIATYAFGDAENDMSMFQEVDNPILVQKIDGKWANIKLDHLIKINKIGPEGFNKAVEKIMKITYY